MNFQVHTIVMNNIIPENVFVIKNGSPLLIGDNDDCIYASSELCGFDGKLKNYIEVDNKSLIVLSKLRYSVYPRKY